MAERRSVTGVEGLAPKASRKSTRRKSHPLTVQEKAEKARAKAKRRSATGTEYLAVEAARLPARLNTDPLSFKQKAKKPWQIQYVIDNLGSVLSKKQKKVELRPKDGMRKVHKR